MAKPIKLSLHIGADYGVAMLPGEDTSTATVSFGRCQDRGSRRKAKNFVARFNSQPALYKVFLAVQDLFEAKRALATWEEENPANSTKAWDRLRNKVDLAESALAAAVQEV